MARYVLDRHVGAAKSNGGNAPTCSSTAGLPWTSRDDPRPKRFHPAPPVNRWEFAHGTVTWPQWADRSAKRRDDLSGEQVEGPPVVKVDRDQGDAEVDERLELADRVLGRWAHHPVDLVRIAA